MSQTVLRIDASGTLSDSSTRAATARVVADLAPTETITRDLAAAPLPQVDEAWIKARLVPAETRSTDEQAALALSDTLIDELNTADTIVIGMPVYNFGMPAALKAWIDLVARPKVTFSYTEGGPVGLLKDKKAIIVAASGGTQIGGQGDFATPHLQHVLGFLGITDVTVMTAKEVLADQAA